MREAWALGRARGIALPDDFVAQPDGFRGRTAGRDEGVDAERSRGRQPARGAVAVGRGRADGEGGGRIAAPVNATLYAAVKPYCMGRRGP